jgi:hypothetical protein
MSTLILHWEFLDYWHHGTGGGADPELDNRVHLDSSGLPVLSASAVKGLLKEAVRRHARFADGLDDHQAEVRAGILFGADNPKGPSEPGLLQFQEARIPHQTATTVRAEALGQFLRTRISQTAREPDYGDGTGGVARDRTLRSMEVALPCVLVTAVSDGGIGSGEALPREWTVMLEEALPFLREACGMRHRGLGRCRVTVAGRVDSPNPEIPPSGSLENPAPGDRVPQPETLWFKATLLSPTVLSVSSRTEGGHHTLRQIHGSEWLGVLAGKAAGRHPALLTALLRGDIRFSHSLPTASGRQAVPMPMCFAQAKGDEDGTIHNALSGTLDADIQWEPVAGGFFDGSTILDPPIGRQLRASVTPGSGDRASDGRLFEFEHLKPGASFTFCVTAPKPFIAVIQQHLSGEVRIGRARSSGHGRVRVTAIDPVQRQAPRPYPNHEGRLVLLLTSDLALVRSGAAVVQPEPVDFGWDSSLRWSAIRSFIKVRRYSPWNSFHKGATLEREVIEAGSVLVFERDRAWQAEELATLQKAADNGFGLHRNEGLGRALINPPWLVDPAPRHPLRAAPPIGDGGATGQTAGVNEPSQTHLLNRLRSQGNQIWDLRQQLLTAGQEMAEALRQTAQSIPAPRQWQNLEAACLDLLKQRDSRQGLSSVERHLREPDRGNRTQTKEAIPPPRWRKEWAAMADRILECLHEEDSKDPDHTGRALRVLILACRILARTQQASHPKDSQ